MAEIVTITGVGPRDGLQLIAQVVPTAAKMQWISGTDAAGVRDIEVGAVRLAASRAAMADSWRW